MTANLTLLIVVGILMACGVYLLLERTVSRMLLGILLFSNAVNLLILTMGGPGGAPPIQGASDADHDTMADPLAQALVLTAIVITMGVSAFVLALAYRSYILTTSEKVENDPEDVGIAARPPEEPEE
ncbi:Na(+)/H(+) antiporter subunit C [Nocardia jinanensis]|uniref:Na(+)/H(+) antiporter subunit C n=1 Tax=Nocardia jinanensis TaxID=382504 RepID=A0A917VXF7_9NOCA|nr:Na(+)/H(+) antiporter subunit C [Nocardia jinanensis]GGL28488.1 Na(+)/H(+) antiporter subunit C [Nocardia jinanensis]